MLIKLENIHPVNHKLLIEKVLEDEGPVMTKSGLTIFQKAGNFMRVKVIRCAPSTPDYPMLYKPNDILVIPRSGIKADYTIEGKDYTFISMFDVIAVEKTESFTERIQAHAKGKVN